MPFTSTASANEIEQDGGFFGAVGAMQVTDTRGKLIECIKPQTVLIAPSPFSDPCDGSFVFDKKVEYVPSKAKFDDQVKAAAISKRCPLSPTAVKRTTVRKSSI